MKTDGNGWEPMKSKASRIRELYAQGLTTAEIASIVGCSREYVRVAGRQRKDGSNSPADVAWRTKHFGSNQAYWKAHNERTKDRRSAYYRKRYWDDPEYRAQHLARCKAHRCRKRLASAENRV